MPRLCRSTSGSNAPEFPWRTRLTSASSGTPALIVEPPVASIYSDSGGKVSGQTRRKPAPMSDSAAAGNLDAKPVSASSTTLATLMEPLDANPMGNIHGGVIMKLVDQAAAAAAIRHAERICVTVSVDRLDFFNPVHVGDMLTLKSS